MSCRRALFLGASLFVFSATAAFAGGAKYIKFDPPKSGHQSAVAANGLNQNGDVAGFYFTEKFERGYVRFSDGTFASYKTKKGAFPELAPAAINDGDVLTGTYDDGSGTSGGFFTNASGKVQVFNVPGDSITFPRAINDSGDIAGSCHANGEHFQHGFVRKADGTYQIFEAPNAGTGTQQGTFVTSLNSAGYISGDVVDSNSVYHGFVRAPDGTITVIDVAGAQITYVHGLNDSSDVTGDYVDSAGVTHGYLRDSKGAVVEFDAPSAVHTIGESVNNSGAVTGYYDDSQSNLHGYIRSANGKITTFDVPGAIDTQPVSINDAGVVAGWYVDSDGLEHSFLRVPK